MITYDYVKKSGMETILKGVKVLYCTNDHEMCKFILKQIKATCDCQLALEDIEIAREKGDIEAMKKAIQDYGLFTQGGA